MDRRRCLAATAAAFGGCLGFGSPPDGETGTGTRTSGAGAEFAVETVATGLDVPWGAAYRDGDLHLTERPGRIARVRDGTVERLVETVPELRSVGEGGLLGLAVHPTEPIAYTYGTYAGASGPENRLVRHDPTDGWRSETLLGGIPAGDVHDGGRLLIRREGDAGGDGADGGGGGGDGRGAFALYVTCGDAGRSDLAQDPDSLAGAVLRLTLDGRPHPENPFGNEVFSYGHRNPQGVATRRGGPRLYATEHGPDVDDEINVLRAGANYGWPAVTGRSDGRRYADPIATYTPTIAPASAAFYAGPIEAWRGDLFFGALAGEHLHRVRIRDGRVVERERLLDGAFGRLRTAFVDPDGHLCVTTSNRDGRGDPATPDDRALRLRPPR